MATFLKHIADKEKNEGLSAESMSFAIVVAEWNRKITEALLQSAVNTLLAYGASEDHIYIEWVPGTVELTYGAKIMSEHLRPDAVICIGCVIRGETPHFDYVCQSATYGITQLNIQEDIPFIFCVLTTNDLSQAEERAGGKYGNKGEEAAIAAITMVAMHEKLDKIAPLFDDDDEI